ncbi:MAG: transglycosylase SLT domain-containing protein [Pseudomonadota bacterium]|nr:transglycosylase SLT domain-containing protein [Pseudomonadota bacterium]
MTTSKRAPTAPAYLTATLTATLLMLGGCANLQGSGSADPSREATATAPAVTTPGTPTRPAPAVATAAPAPSADALPPLANDASIVDITTVPLLPRTRLDPDQDARRTDLWQRVRNGFQMPDLQDEYVAKWEQWYASRPDYVQRMTERGGRYLFYIVEEVQRRGMPTELALLPFIESAFNPQATSQARASGMWQFMPATGKDFELHQNLFRDDRRDVLASTQAALDYLQKLNTLFDGDWQLTLAAYNWGQGNVLKAMERNRRAGKPTDYSSLSMPTETREYVPKLQAVKNIIGQPALYLLSLPPLENHPFFLSVAIERDIDVALAARLSGLSLGAFQELNPQMNKPVILAAGTPQVLLPYDNANQFLRALARHDGALATWTAWVAPRTIKVAEAARLTGISESELRQVNHIPPRMLVKRGSTLLVPRPPGITVDVAEHIADNGNLALAPETRPLRRVAFKAGRRGDSVSAVARRYRVSASQVAQWNGVKSTAHFKAGQTVVVMLPPSRTSLRPARRTAKAGSGASSVKQVSTRNPSARTSRPAKPSKRRVKRGR